MKRLTKSNLGSLANPGGPSGPAHLSVSPGAPNISPNGWNVAASAGGERVRVRNFEEAIERVAPLPGSKLYMEARRLNCRWYGLQPMLFSAIDLCSHLQIARVYLTQTVGSAVDFLDFLVDSYPFAIREVYTPPDLWFCDPVVPQVIHRFSRACALRNMVHTVLSNPSQDIIIRKLRAYFYHTLLESSEEGTSEQLMIPDLRNHLLVHNNFTALDTIAGQVPIEKLRSYSAFESIEHFDPYAAKPASHGTSTD